jgi:hypothetical protein
MNFFCILIKDPMYAIQHLLFASTLAFFDTLYILIYMHTNVFYAHFFDPNEFSNDSSILEVGALAIVLTFSCHLCCLSGLFCHPHCPSYVSPLLCCHQLIAHVFILSYLKLSSMLQTTTRNLHNYHWFLVINATCNYKSQ